MIFFWPDNSKIYAKQPQYNETSFIVNIFSLYSLYQGSTVAFKEIYGS